MIKIVNAKLRRILDSTGKLAYEAEIVVEGGYKGIASAPSAILAGIRERKVSCFSTSNDFCQELINNYYDQYSLDKLLEGAVDYIGTDISLSISLAFARAYCKKEDTELVNYIKSLVPVLRPENSITPLIPFFSGGVHAPWQNGSIQQIMLKVCGLPFDETVKSIQRIYNEVEQYLKDKQYYAGLAASSGFLTQNITPTQQFEILSLFIEKSSIKHHLSIAIDVAAEHLKKGEDYIYFGETYSPIEFEELLYSYIKQYPISYVEDPFDCYNRANWITLKSRSNNETEFFSDDYSATQSKYIDTQISDGVIIKMKQVGTLIGTLQMIYESTRLGLKTCVSHRSCETEDTFICDLAVATNADLIKMGGLRRGDRVEKYNRLLRLFNMSL